MNRIALFLLLVAFQSGYCRNHHHQPKQWALLVAGSNGYFNYRHQADVCHAYHIVKDHGIPDERIIVMMYDDIAYSKENPTPGIIINRPDGPDVYGGVKKDYIWKDVNPTNFLNVLQGNKEAMKNIGSGQVIDSGPDDHVFVYYADHGAPGLVAFPDGKLLHAKSLHKALQSMHKAKKFKKLVFYLEACESGSMFENHLSPNLNIYAVTASNTTRSSYACYLDKVRKTFLGDLFSVKWMEDSDRENLNKETIHQQYTIAKRETNMSRVMQYGDMNVALQTVGQFQGDVKPPRNRTTEMPPVELSATPAEDVPMTILKKRVEWAKTKEQQEKAKMDLNAAVKERHLIADTMLTIVQTATSSSEQRDRIISGRHELTDWDCYESLVDHFGDRCFHFGKHEHALRHLYALGNMCEERIPSDVIHAAIERVCG